MSSARTLLLFTRCPRAEARAKGLPVKSGTRLFARFLESWREAADRVRASLLVVAPPSSVPALRRQFGSSVASFDVQRGESFASRIDDAVTRALAGGAAPLVLVAGDTPAPEPLVLEETFARLERGEHQVVLEPSSDGGVNLIGLTDRVDGLLTEIAWNSGKVECDLREKARLRDLRVYSLPERLDIDRIDDVEQARRLADFSPDWIRFRSLLESLVQDRCPPTAIPVRLPASGRCIGVSARAPPPPLP
jgi:glycosyltransferase A (GT-A) superfamily protein (DUF2064 family)